MISVDGRHGDAQRGVADAQHELEGNRPVRIGNGRGLVWMMRLMDTFRSTLGVPKPSWKAKCP